MRKKQESSPPNEGISIKSGFMVKVFTNSSSCRFAASLKARERQVLESNLKKPALCCFTAILSVEGSRNRWHLATLVCTFFPWCAEARVTADHGGGESRQVLVGVHHAGKRTAHVTNSNPEAGWHGHQSGEDTAARSHSRRHGVQGGDACRRNVIRNSRSTHLRHTAWRENVRLVAYSLLLLSFNYLGTNIDHLSRLRNLRRCQRSQP